MLAVELNISPIDEDILGPLAGDLPSRSPSQGVGIEDHPLAASGDPTRAWVEPNSDAFISDVQAIAGDLVAMGKHVAIVHCAPDLDAARFGTSAITHWQLTEVTLVDRKGRRIGIGLEELLANVMDHVVLLRGDHPCLCGHVAIAVRKRAVHGMWITTVFELALCETQSRGERT